MTDSEILRHIDHTLLKATATWDEIREICDDAVKYHTASVCIPPCYVKLAAEYLEGRIPVCTVVGFPLGYSTAAAKLTETEEAIRDGASEVDMVVNLADVKNGNFPAVEKEIASLKRAAGDKILKVIIETCYLTETEKVELCKAVTNAGADFIKTSTGFGTAGAKIEDIGLFKKHIGPKVKMKAAGGVKTREDLERFLQAGCERIGTSSAVKILSGGAVSSY